MSLDRAGGWVTGRGRQPAPGGRIGAAMHTTELLSRHWISKGTFQLELSRPPGFAYAPGQRIRFHHGAIERDYSLISTPADSTLALCIRQVQGGRFSTALARAEMGTPFYFSGPYGYFTFRSSSRPVVFVATGTGIAPFVSLARSGVGDFPASRSTPAQGTVLSGHLPKDRPPVRPLPVRPFGRGFRQSWTLLWAGFRLPGAVSAPAGLRFLPLRPLRDDSRRYPCH